MKEIGRKFKNKFEGYKNKWDFDSRLIHLFEETGELAEIILQCKGLKTPSKNKDDIKVALADIIDDVYALAILSGISIEELTNEVLKSDEQ